MLERSRACARWCVAVPIFLARVVISVNCYLSAQAPLIRLVWFVRGLSFHNLKGQCCTLTVFSSRFFLPLCSLAVRCSAHTDRPRFVGVSHANSEWDQTAQQWPKLAAGHDLPRRYSTVCVCMCVCVCVSACVRACVRACACQHKHLLLQFLLLWTFHSVSSLRSSQATLWILVNTCRDNVQVSCHNSELHGFEVKPINYKFDHWMVLLILLRSLQAHAPTERQFCHSRKVSLSFQLTQLGFFLCFHIGTNLSRKFAPVGTIHHRSPAGLRCLFFFRLIQLSVLIFVGEEKEESWFGTNCLCGHKWMVIEVLWSLSFSLDHINSFDQTKIFYQDLWSSVSWPCGSPTCVALWSSDSDILPA